MDHSRAQATRVLLTTDSVGGVWTYALDLAQGLSRRGIACLLATMGGPLSAAQRADCMAIPGLEVAESAYRVEWMCGAGEDLDAAEDWLLELAERWCPHLVHLNQYAFVCLPWNRPVLLAAHSCVVSWFRAVRHGSPPAEWTEYGRMVRLALRAADAVVAPTAAFLDQLERVHGPLPRARVVHNGRPAAARPAAAKRPFVLMAGRLWDEAKGAALLDGIAAGLPWPVVAVGALDSPDGAAALQPRALRITGPLPRRELNALLGEAAVFAAPAAYEPFGLAVLEAAQQGCALLLSGIPSFRELWDGAARFVPAAEAPAWRDALLELMGRPAECERLGRAAAARAERYGADRMVQGYAELYGELIGAPACRSLAAVG